MSKKGGLESAFSKAISTKGSANAAAPAQNQLVQQDVAAKQQDVKIGNSVQEMTLEQFSALKSAFLELKDDFTSFRHEAMVDLGRIDDLEFRLGDVESSGEAIRDGDFSLDELHDMEMDLVVPQSGYGVKEVARLSSSSESRAHADAQSEKELIRLLQQQVATLLARVATLEAAASASTSQFFWGLCCSFSCDCLCPFSCDCEPFLAHSNP
jgi:hypothetical protein